jgi:Regulator of chromosome condensation (RCC1) repeat
MLWQRGEFLLVNILHPLTVAMMFTDTQVKALDGKGIGQVACGWEFSLAMSHDGKHLYSFGRNDYGQLGIGQISRETKHTPQPVPLPLAPLTAIVAGSSHALAITTLHKVYTWGCNDSYQIGHAEGQSVSIPRLLDLSHVRKGSHCLVYDASAGINHTLFLVKLVAAPMPQPIMSSYGFLRPQSPCHLLINEPPEPVEHAVIAALGDDVTGEDEVDPWTPAAAVRCQNCSLFLDNGICPVGCGQTGAIYQSSAANIDPNVDAAVRGLAIRSASAIDTEDTSGMELDESGSASGGAAMDWHASASVRGDDSGTERHENVELPRGKKRRRE